jgi:PAS domain S-box-containing protein
MSAAAPKRSAASPLLFAGLVAVLLLVGLALGWWVSDRHLRQHRQEARAFGDKLAKVADGYLASGDRGRLRRELALLDAPQRLRSLSLADADGYRLAAWERPRIHQEGEWRETLPLPGPGAARLTATLTWGAPLLPGWLLFAMPGLLLVPLGLAGASGLQWLGLGAARAVEQTWSHHAPARAKVRLPGLAPTLARLAAWRQENVDSQARLREQAKVSRLQAEKTGIELRDSQVAESTARQQVRRLRAIFQQSNHPAGFLDPKGVVIDFNAAAVELSGLPLAKLRGMMLTEIVPFGGVTVLDAPLARARVGETVQFQLEVAADGGTRVVAMSLKAIRGDNGAVELLILEGYDISERIRAEKALQETITQFQQSQKMEAIGRLAGGIAHDFNNLLTSILGFGNMALDSLGDEAEARGDLNEVIQAANRAQKLTQKLLALSRKDAPGSQAVNLNQLVQEMDKLIRVTLHEDIDFMIDLDPRPCVILADPTSLEQVIVNLAVNARDAMPRSGRLYIRTQRKALKESETRPFEAKAGTYIVLSVKDTGCGMTPDIIAHAFEPFFTTKESGQGTGLGLSTVYAIVKQYGGFIDLLSRPGEGTTFHLYFPAADANAQLAPEQAAAQPSPLPRGTETILLVEDEEGVRRMASKMIESLGYTVIQAEDGEDGARAAEKYTGTIDLIITDVVMPNLSGPEMINRIRVTVGHIPHIYVSGFTMDKLKQHGADDSEQLLIRKPYTRDQLARRIRQTLDGQKPAV